MTEEAAQHRRETPAEGDPQPPAGRPGQGDETRTGDGVDRVADQPSASEAPTEPMPAAAEPPGDPAATEPPTAEAPTAGPAPGGPPPGGWPGSDPGWAGGAGAGFPPGQQPPWGYAGQGHVPPPGAAFTSRYGLVRPRQGRYLAGVCAAVARATNTDPILWRVLLAVLGFFGGIGILVYVAAWLIIPAEGDTASPVESMLGRGKSSMSPVTVLVLGVLVAVMFGYIVTDAFRAVLLGVAILIGGALLLNRDANRSPAGPPGPLPGAPPPAGGSWPDGPEFQPAEQRYGSVPPGAETAAGRPLDQPTRQFEAVPPHLAAPPASAAPPPASAPAPVGAGWGWPASAPAAAAAGTATGPAWSPGLPTAPPPGGYRPPFAPRGPYAGPYPPGGGGAGGGFPPGGFPPGPVPPSAGGKPPKRPKPPRERSRLGGATFSMIFVAIGLVAVLDLVNAVPVAPSAYFAGALLTIALGLLVGAWFGRARWLIALGLAGAAALGISTVAESYDKVRQDGGTINWTPVGHEAMADRYETQFSDAILDLRQVDFTDTDSQVTVEIDFGKLEVVLPPEVDATVEVEIRAGDAEVFGTRWSGFDEPGREFVDLGSDGAGGGKLRLNIYVNAGNAEVSR
ncbi:PspC domain-containing protein [Solwaraspora sp. WMMD1047]|uniref:PspC domain-containing protein n=1 Tax=Solwaraspora sp. WMMD1047 TaxID=3016102 RepID=UPI002417755F|nr:PspC domain-containing protein [Solwaraspora sp. WMMD1047]MDG4828545.1 PspC domain-containing protein [Solwaraspora sp. WMMD1047]